MKLYRAITNENIDKNNIGCHWTFSKEVAENINSIIYGDNSLDGEFEIIEIDINKDMIDVEATVYSQCEYPKECEVVLKENSQLTDEYNTGNNIDEWVRDFDREDIQSDLQHQVKTRTTNLKEFNTCLDFLEENFEIKPF